MTELQKGLDTDLAPDAAVTDTRRLVLEIHGEQIDDFSYKTAGQRINAEKKRSWPRIVVGATRNLAVCCAVHRASTCSCSIACCVECYRVQGDRV